MSLPAALADPRSNVEQHHAHFELATASVRVTVLRDGEPHAWSTPLRDLAKSHDQRTALVYAVRKGWPVWLEFRVVGGDAAKLLDPPGAWEPGPRWAFGTSDSVADVLQLVDGARELPRPSLKDVLDVLPLLHELGASRAGRDIRRDSFDVTPELLSVLAFIPLMR